MVAFAGGLVDLADLPTDTGWIAPAYTVAATVTDVEIHGRIYGNVASIYLFCLVDLTNVPTSGNVVNTDLVTIDDARFVPSSAPREQGLGSGGRGRNQDFAIWPDGRIRLVALAASSDWTGPVNISDQEMTASGLYLVN